MTDYQSKHDQVVRSLEQRIKNMYPDWSVHRNVEYYDGDHTVGEVDVIRYGKGYSVVIYEVKTGGAKYEKAQAQFNRFVEHHPHLQVKGVYVHPDNGARRLRYVPSNSNQ